MNFEFQAKVFMVGAGALGCEFLKNFALCGVGTQGDGRVVRVCLRYLFLQKNKPI